MWVGGGSSPAEQRQMWFPGFLTSNQVRFMPTFVVGRGGLRGRRAEGVKKGRGGEWGGKREKGKGEWGSREGGKKGWEEREERKC